MRSDWTRVLIPLTHGDAEIDESELTVRLRSIHASPEMRNMTCFRIPIIFSALLCCGLALGQEPDSVAKGDYGDGTGAGTPGTGHGSALQDVIHLNEGQQIGLRRINYALEDALFPLSLEAFQLEWELQRAFRMEPPDEPAIMRISADFDRIEGQFESVIAEHRKMARAILSRQQLMALGRLESALELYQAAQEAIYLNLIDELHAYPFLEGDVNEPVAEAVRLSAGLARLRTRQQDSGSTLLRGR